MIVTRLDLGLNARGEHRGYQFFLHGNKVRRSNTGYTHARMACSTAFPDSVVSYHGSLASAKKAQAARIAFVTNPRHVFADRARLVEEAHLIRVVEISEVVL